MAELKKAELFEYVALFHPTTYEASKGAKSIVIVDRKTVLCMDDKGAFMLACKDVPAEYNDKTDQVEIKVRPF